MAKGNGKPKMAKKGSPKKKPMPKTKGKKC